MSTRATYKIGETTFYCHYDGYREGAALRFAKMIEALTVPADRAAEHLIDAIERRNGGEAFAFIRGNLDAEPAHRNSHDGHGDTEWRYTVETSATHGLILRVSHRRFDVDGWTADAPVKLADFVNTWGKEFEAPQIVTMRPIGRNQSFERIKLATLENARAIAEIERLMASRFQPDNPNRQVHADRATAWETAIAEADVTEAA